MTTTANQLFKDLVQKGRLSSTIAEVASLTAIDVAPVIEELSGLRDYHQLRMLESFQESRVSDYHLGVSTGYGYGDSARDTLDQVMAQALFAESALVREQFVSGTHAIAAALYGLLRPGDEVISATGLPYDTLREVIGIDQASGSLQDFGITYRQVDLKPDGSIDLPTLLEQVSPRTKLVMFQRSRGYSLRPSLSVAEIGQACQTLNQRHPHVLTFVDNCYGELVEKLEPTALGAHLIAGSLIKNLGGGLAPTGGYVAGKAELVEKAAGRLTAPGIGAHVGSSPGGRRLYFQGLFMAPQVVYEALAGAIFAARLFERLGFAVTPRYDEHRSDIIQAITIGTAEGVVAFCQGLQQACPVDGFVLPEPNAMPGYADPVIMAGGTFIQGATSELSADAPIREPYAVYFQGGLSQTFVRLGAVIAAQKLYDRALLP
ncbi:hypothetical protein F9B85_00610 [Heliorestis acidaminivorans]|uniref:Methionine gamma-lyase family protein n=1 Tax=Heliorestis acidaminivorans TaxID=553427 RepID=A0A6I0F3Z0_9FIRM|nr:methionine gamma-lyase family protein [Heliorestis acidaminivorans]KAB2954233.1 hypothetical protein F9B85_00610 [Heliorestis acidaminivorans]